MTRDGHHIAIIGAGLSGTLLAISLVDRGFDVAVYERRPDIRLTGATEGKSINLALSTRGIHALQQAGIWDKMQQIVIPMRGRLMHSVDEELTFQPYGRDEREVINSISRVDLNIALLNAAQSRGAALHFQQRSTEFDLKTGRARVRDEQTGKETLLEPSTVIAADGAGSAIRSEMIKASRFNFSQQYLDYGYKELTIPADPAGTYLLEKHALHIWPRGTYMLIALPNIDGTFASILFMPYEGEVSFAALQSPEQVKAFFAANFPDALRLMPGLIENYNAHPVGSMVTVRCDPWHVEGRALLIGDAAHAIVPFFGQGLNCAFEDCSIFLDILDRRGPDWPLVFDEFQHSRKRDANAIADLALENFIEMRDRVADPRFLFRKKVEFALEERFPGVFVPKYAMVTFNRIPYSVAQSRGATQDQLLSELCDGIDRLEDLDWNKAAFLVARDLAPLHIPVQ